MEALVYIVNVRLERLKKADIETWNQYVRNSGSFYTIAHNPSLGLILQKTFKYPYINYLLFRNGDLCGIMPLCIVGKEIVSMPHFSYGGVITGEKEDPLELYKQICSIHQRYEIRTFESVSPYYDNSKIVNYLELMPTSEEQMRTFPSKLRSQIKRGIKNDMTLKVGAIDLLDDFYDVYSLNMHRLGSPVLSKAFFRNLLLYYENGESRLFCVYHNGKVIGCSFVLMYLQFSEVCWASTLREFNMLQTNMYLYWSMIEYVIKSGMRIFSFGRSTRGSSTHRFKQQWGTRDKSLYFNYSNERRLNIKKVRFLSEIWKRIPFKVANVLGPTISKRIY